MRSVAVTDTTLIVRATNVEVPASVTVGSAGATFGSGDFETVIPAGAVPDGAEFQLVATDDQYTAPAEIVPRAQFEGSDAVIHRVVDVADVVLSATASAPIQVPATN